jgi:hypothetical protein
MYRKVSDRPSRTAELKRADAPTPLFLLVFFHDQIFILVAHDPFWLSSRACPGNTADGVPVFSGSSKCRTLAFSFFAFFAFKCSFRQAEFFRGKAEFLDRGQDLGKAIFARGIQRFVSLSRQSLCLLAQLFVGRHGDNLVPAERHRRQRRTSIPLYPRTGHTPNPNETALTLGHRPLAKRVERGRQVKRQRSIDQF